MANKSIAGLTSATVPLASTDLLPVYQTSTTFKATVANVQAAPVSVGTANCVQYLNGSKVPTTLSTFAFDGTNFGVGTASPSTYGQAAVIGTGAPVTFIGGNVNAANVPVGTLKFGSTASSNAYINYGGQIASYTVGGIDQCELRFFVSNGATSAESVRFDYLGNIVPKTAAKGVNFTANTPQAGMISQLLNWYEAGTWTPTLTAGAGSITAYTASGNYTRIGRQITAHCSITVSNNGTGSLYILVSGMPFDVGGALYPIFGNNNSIGAQMTGTRTGTVMYVQRYDGTYPLISGQTILLTSVYIV